MTNYSTTDNQRETIYFWLAILSIAISSILMQLSNNNINKIIVPSGFLIFGLLILLFDNFLWKLKPFSLFVNIPDLNGKWTGTNKRTDNSTNNFVVEITQTWKKIDIVVTSENTISRTCSATFFIDNKSNKSIRYIFTMKPIQPVKDKNLFGEGCAEIRISQRKNEILLHGEYYSSNYLGGHFSLTKERVGKLQASH